MEHQYLISISNRNLYKEIELHPAQAQIRIGTDKSCDVRLRKQYFFEGIELNLINENGIWTLMCGDNLYLTTGDVRKLRARILGHGDSLEVRYQESDNLVFNLEFSIDFAQGKHVYNSFADVSGLQRIAIGTSENCHIVLSGSYVGTDLLELYRNNEGFELRGARTTFGIVHNGRRAGESVQIKDGDFFSIADYFFYLRREQLWMEDRPDIQIYQLPVFYTVDRGQYPAFRRNSRMRVAVNEEKIPILDPAQKPQKPKNNLLLRLLPSMGMVLAAILMASMGRSSMIIFSLASVLCAGLTAVLTFKENKKDYQEALVERNETYKTYISSKCAEIEGYRNEERRILEEIYISQKKEIAEVHEFSSDLFDRSRDDPDYLFVRLGTGSIESNRPVDYKKQEKLEPGDELQQIPEQVEARYHYLENAPVVCDLKAYNAVGIIGSSSARYEMMKNLTIDLAARHYMGDVKLMFVASEENKDKVRWLRMLPHVWNENLQIRNIVMDEESRTVLFEYLYKLLTARESEKGYKEHYVIFFYDECGFQRHPISRFTESARGLGFTFIFFGQTRADIPQGCGQLIDLGDQQDGILTDMTDRNHAIKFSYPVLQQSQAERIVSILAPVYTEEVSLEGSLTRNISLFQLLNILAVEDLDLTNRWARSNVTRSMAAPIGVTKTGQISLDLHDKAHGPHGLVAGTTGSGKSEILQTYILSMVTLFRPDEVGFVIIDFKGGGMVNQFEQLPHLMGAITNIDGKEIDRSLKSIKAELRKRQSLFKDADVNHIDRYIQKYKNREVQVPLPHLIIIVDEFAELKAAQPEFMKELISAARIGRSLGVHLILATQKPAGQVNEQIWSNSRFKLCLKVQGPEDSNEMLKSPLAAEIKEPGRAYLQVGNNEIFELLQSAYSGAPESTDDSHMKSFAIYELSDSARRIPVYSQKKQEEEGAQTQLNAVVRYVKDYCSTNKIQKIPDICLPSLPALLTFPEKNELINKDIYVTTELGIYDDPDNQVQDLFKVDFTNQNVMIIGSSQSGKTNVLQNMIRSIATKYSPDEVSIYILDFASMFLKNFESLNHVGGVVTPRQDEALKNLLKLLFSEIESRKEKILSAGVSSFAAYKESGRKDLPQILLMIDNLTALREVYFQTDDDDLLKLCREGLAVGISIVIANSMTNGIGYRYLSNFSCRIALFCNDSAEYSNLFEHCRQSIYDIHGRALVEIDKQLLDCQMFLAFEGEKESDRAKSIKDFISVQNKKYGRASAATIPTIPEKLDQAFIEEYCSGAMQSDEQLVAGLDYATVAPLSLNLAELGLLALTGRPGMGQTNFLSYLVTMTEKMHPGRNLIYIVDDMKRKLRNLAELPQVKAYEYLSDKTCDMVKGIESELKHRYHALEEDENSLEREAQIILILNNPDSLNSIAGDKDTLEAYRNILGRFKNMKVCVLIGHFENAQVPFSVAEPIKKVKDNHHFLYFDDIINMKIYDLPVKWYREHKKALEAGDCFYIHENECRRIKTPMI